MTIVAILAALALAFAASGAMAQQAEQVPLEQGARSRMTVQVMLNGAGPFPFVVDTGAERTVVSHELARTLGLASSGRATVHGITRSTPVDTVNVDTLAIARHEKEGIRAPLLAAGNLGGSGLIGIDSLANRQVTIDFRRGVMVINPSSAKTGSAGRQVEVDAYRRAGRMVIMDASVDGQSVALVLDTGSEISVGNPALRRKLERKRGYAAETIELRDVTGGTLAAQYHRTRKVKIAHMGLTELPVAFADAPVFREMGLDERPAMLLGMDALRVFDRVSIDFGRRTARFLLPSTGTRASPFRLAGLRRARQG